MLDVDDALRAVVPSPQHIIPGHDPLVMCPAPSRLLEGAAVEATALPRQLREQGRGVDQARHLVGRGRR